MPLEPVVKSGQIVKLRRRLWRVDEVIGDEFVATAIDGMGETRRRFLTTLEKPVPGALEAPSYGELGNASSQDLLLRAYRLSMLHGSAPFLSLQRSSVIPVNYQLVPLVVALEQPRVRLLIADDVGLGKTVEAGLILSELLARGRVKRFLVVTPASLRDQWQQALDHFFHIETRILSGHTRRQYEKELPAGANPWQYFHRVIVSIDYAKDPENKLKILEQPWDLVLVDEAHNAAKPHQTAPDQRVEMDRWQLVTELAAKATHLLLLTATPHNGYTDSFASLVTMLDDGLVYGPVHDPGIDRKRARRYVCQRSRRDVERWFDEHGMKCPFPRHDQRDHQEVIIPIHKDLKGVITEVERHSVRLLEEAKKTRRYRMMAEWLVLHFQKRALSSPAALRESLKNRIAEIDRRLGETEEAAVERAPSEALLVRNVFDEDTGERADQEEASRRCDKAVFGDPDSLRAERRALVTILEDARAITPAKDSKLRRLHERVLPQLLRRAPRVIVFTRYKDTLDYLVGQLEKKLPKGTQIFWLHGDLSQAARREEFRKFEQSDKAVLVATDVISEGLNLQHACSQVVHYELPWNPNRLEQRNGRVDRFGQQAEEVVIRTMVMDETLDIAILELLIRKAYRIREDRGFCPPYFGDEVSIAHLIRSHRRATQQQLELFAAHDDALEEALQRRITDPLGDDVVERVAKDCFYGETDVSLPDITERLERSQRLIGSPAQVRGFVESALNCYRCTIREERDRTLTIHLPERRLQLPAIGSKLEKATFNPEAAMADPDLVVLDIGHPLVRRLIDLVREDFFRTGANNGRTAAMVTDAVSHVTVLHHYLVRFLVGTTLSTVIEELVPVAFPVYGDAPCTAEETAALLAATPKPRNPKPDEAEPHYDHAAGNPLMQTALDAAVARRLDELVRERRELKQKLEAEGDPAIQDWLAGIDRLSLASTDLLTATLYLPR